MADVEMPRRKRNGKEDGKMAVQDHRVTERHLAAIRQRIEDLKPRSTEEIDLLLKAITASGETPRFEPRTPLQKAQELVYQAWESPKIRDKIRLARQALEVCPDCADAYVLLAEESARSTKKAFELYGAGVEAGERALGEGAFTELAGEFWGMLETRPYMRARAGLAHCLCILGRHREAVDHYMEMLRLNPDDNQGIRYSLANCLLTDLDDMDSLMKLLRRYEGDISAAWLHTWALAAFVRDGDTEDARRRLLEAFASNPHVIPYLLFQEDLPEEPQTYMTIGGEDEAIVYVLEFGLAWYTKKGAIDWLTSGVLIRAIREILQQVREIQMRPERRRRGRRRRKTKARGKRKARG